MSDDWIDVRTTLAASRQTRVEIGRDGVLHVLAGPITLHLERAACEDLTTTLARAMVALARNEPRQRPPSLVLVPPLSAAPPSGDPAQAGAAYPPSPTVPASSGQ
ncbi:MAG: hypothetical protein RL685_5037 [Pseudomonadota bacterium]|jgi:hypothetical protein